MGKFLFRWLCHFVAGGMLPSFPPHFFFRGTSTRNEYEKKMPRRVGNRRWRRRHRRRYHAPADDQLLIGDVIGAVNFTAVAKLDQASNDTTLSHLVVQTKCVCAMKNKTTTRDFVFCLFYPPVLSTQWTLWTPATTLNVRQRRRVERVLS